MDLVVDLSDALQVRIHSHPVTQEWHFAVRAQVQTRCTNGVLHEVPIRRTRMITSFSADHILQAFEWSIRGDRSAMVQLAAAVIDHELKSSFVDPCQETP